MNPTRPDDEAIFHVARQIGAPEARSAYLDQVCGADRRLRGEVEALLSAYEQDRGFLETPAVSPPAVIDAGAITDPTERVAEVLPGAFVKRLDDATFAESANAALGTIEGAAFFLFLHDDVELRAGAVQAMVEEAFRSNAGIVGAKLVDWDDPEHLRSVGSSIDKFGFEWPVAELNELDQGQHDAVRESFVVSTAAMLVRCDLFADLGGFSTDIDGAA